MSDDSPQVTPDTASVGRGHDASRHGGSLKMPLYETSVFVFETAEEGKRFFEVTYALEDAVAGEDLGYIYSRLDNPNLRVVESRLAYWEEADDALVFNSGIAAISTILLTLLRPGDVILYSSPVYGGTATLFKGLMSDFGVVSRPFDAGIGEADLAAIADEGRLAMVYLETPANPTNEIFDIEMASRVAREHGAFTVVDNTFLGPVWQKPMRHGADLVLHSATKFLGGHSDITAGVVCGGQELIDEIRHTRYRIGTTAQPSTAWLLTRSVETLRLRVERQTASAISVAAFLLEHPKVASVAHLSLLTPDHPRHDIYKRQCLGPGSMISFEVAGGELESFRLLNAMEVINLAVSLGGTESLASHPWTMSHSTMPSADKMAIGVTPGLIRLSIGLESPEDLIADLSQALDLV